MKHGTVIVVFIALLVVGCAQEQRLKVTYISDPPGGTLYKQSGQLWGPCPKILWYDLDENTLARGYLAARGLMVRWPDGSEKESDKLITIPLDGTDHRYTFVRSEDEPNAPYVASPTEKQIEATIETIDLKNGMTMDFALIPGGTFIMNHLSDEEDQHSDVGRMVRISKSFYLSVYEVTQEQYEKVMGTNPSKLKGSRHPVETVSWRDAQRFCQRLSRIDNRQYRLPTEAEWEYACRAGTTTVYYWGDDFDGRYAWVIANSEATTHEVGTRLPNAWGLHDMAGNVAEWCEDSYGPYDPNSAEQVDPKGPSEGVYRILRGGSWVDLPVSSQSGHRNWHTLNHAYDDCGIRIVLELE